MFERLRAAWRPIRHGTPGRRFEQFHASRKAQRRGRPWRFLFLAGGLSAVVVGVILLPAPGPGWLVIFVGLAMLTQESLTIARALDKLEMRLRRLAPGGRKVRRGG